jgi:hypothetical protein
MATPMPLPSIATPLPEQITALAESLINTTP